MHAGLHAQPTTAPVVDLKPMEGDYTVTQATRGKDRPDAAMMAAMRVSIHGDHMTVSAGGRDQDIRIVRFDGTQQPMLLDTARPGEPGGAAQTYPRICKLEGDTLSICFAREGGRPTSFEPTAANSTMVLKRAAATTRP